MPLVVVDTPADELVLVHAETRAEVDAPAGQVVEHRYLLREPNRLVEGQLPDHGAEPQLAGRAREGGEVHRWRRDAPYR